MAGDEKPGDKQIKFLRQTILNLHRQALERLVPETTPHREAVKYRKLSLEALDQLQTQLETYRKMVTRVEQGDMQF